MKARCQQLTNNRFVDVVIVFSVAAPLATCINVLRGTKMKTINTTNSIKVKKKKKQKQKKTNPGLFSTLLGKIDKHFHIFMHHQKKCVGYMLMSKIKISSVAFINLNVFLEESTTEHRNRNQLT
uniref:Uncharacterized protein n=1 Tax=Glossina brevipalpis TaxID=37001 RepID=A0A1A9X1Q4_9MUSC